MTNERWKRFVGKSCVVTGAGVIEAAGGTAMARGVDVSSEDAVRNLIAATAEAYGGLDMDIASMDVLA